MLIQKENCIETKLGLLMNSLIKYYSNNEHYIDKIQEIVNQETQISLRLLDWFISNYAKKHRIILNNIDVYQNYKLQLKSFSKKQFDPFCRKGKMLFFYTDDKSIETSCGQLCFFRWCFENNILNYVETYAEDIEQDMKNCLNTKKSKKTSCKKREPLSLSASRSLSSQKRKYIVSFN